MKPKSKKGKEKLKHKNKKTQIKEVGTQRKYTRPRERKAGKKSVREGERRGNGEIGRGRGGVKEGKKETGRAQNPQAMKQQITHEIRLRKLKIRELWSRLELNEKLQQKLTHVQHGLRYLFSVTDAC